MSTQGSSGGLLYQGSYGIRGRFRKMVPGSIYSTKSLLKDRENEVQYCDT